MERGGKKRRQTAHLGRRARSLMIFISPPSISLASGRRPCVHLQRARACYFCDIHATYEVSNKAYCSHNITRLFIFRINTAKRAGQSMFIATKTWLSRIYRVRHSFANATRPPSRYRYCDQEEVTSTKKPKQILGNEVLQSPEDFHDRSYYISFPLIEWEAI